MAALMFSGLVWKTRTFLKTIILGHLQIAVQTTNTIKISTTCFYKVVMYVCKLIGSYLRNHEHTRNFKKNSLGLYLNRPIYTCTQIFK